MIKKLILALLVVGAMACSIHATTRPCSKLQNVTGANTYLAMNNSKSVAVMTLEQNRKPPFVVTSPGIALSSDEHKQLEKLLFDDAHYIFGRKKRALFIPYVKLVFDSKESATLYISKSSQEILIKNNTRDVYLNYDPMASDLNSLLSHIVQKGK